MEIKKPLVSIVMAAYNADHIIAAAIRSVQAQTVSDWELLVLDDSSKDRTVETVAEIAKADCRIRLYTNDVNSGVAVTRNKGLSLCRGSYITFLDSDDIWYPEKLQIQMEKLQHTGADICYTSYAIVDKAGNAICRDYIVPECLRKM